MDAIARAAYGADVVTRARRSDAGILAVHWNLPKRGRVKSNPVDELVFQCKAAKLPAPGREYRFHPTRRWRFDLAWSWDVGLDKPKVVPLLAVEVDGGVYVQGRHSRGKGIEADMEKIATAMTMGWRVLRVTPRHIRSGQALQWIEKLLG